MGRLRSHHPRAWGRRERRTRSGKRACILGAERRRGAHPATDLCILVVGAMPKATGMTADELRCLAEAVREERFGRERVCCAPPEMAAQTGPGVRVARLVRPIEADPVYLSHNRPCLLISRSRDD